MPIPPINISPTPSAQSTAQLREAVRLLTKHINDQEVEQARLAAEQSKITKVLRPDIIIQAPSTQQPVTNIARQSQPSAPSSTVTGLIGLLAQGQHTLVPQYAATPMQADPAIINGSLFLDSADHLWYVDHTTVPFTFTDLSLVAGQVGFAAGTRASKPAAAASNADTFYFETDTRWLYYSTGSAWTYIAGILFATRATRVALTLVNPADDNALAYDTDYGVIWRATAGAWVNFTFGALQVSFTPTTVQANVTTDQTLLSYSVPANLLNVQGKTLRLIVSGIYDVDTALNITWKIKLGGVTILSWTPITPAGLLTELPWRVQCEIITATTGATGTVEAHGVIFAEDKKTAGHSNSPQLDLNIAASAAIDLTATALLDITVNFDTASVSNRCQRRSTIIELMN